MLKTPEHQYGDFEPPPYEMEAEVEAEPPAANGGGASGDGEGEPTEALDKDASSDSSQSPQSGSSPPQHQGAQDMSSLTPIRLFKSSKNQFKRKSKQQTPDLSTQRANLLMNVNKVITDYTAAENSKKKDDDWEMIGALVASRLRNCTCNETREKVLESMIFPALGELKRV